MSHTYNTSIHPTNYMYPRIETTIEPFKDTKKLRKHVLGRMYAVRT